LILPPLNSYFNNSIFVVFVNFYNSSR